MKLNKQNRVLLAVIGFLMVGTIAVSLTHRPNVPVSQEQNDLQLIRVGDYFGYIEHVRPWLQAALRDQSLDTVAQIKMNLLNVNSSDKEIGPAHINLFLAFDSWEKFLQTRDPGHRQQVNERLELVAELMPELSPDIQQLNKILN